MVLVEKTQKLSQDYQNTRRVASSCCNAHAQKRRSRRAIHWVACLAVLSVTTLALDSPLSSLVNNAPTHLGFNWPWPWPSKGEPCRPPSANLFALHPPRPSNDLIIKASEDLDKYLTDRASKPDIDSIAIAVVTSNGPIFEGGYGVLRANESDSGVQGEPLPVDRDSIYRIASISKMFTVLETLILRERGALNWDDPVEKYLPDFSPPSESYGWATYLDGLQAEEEKPRITLRQLASHLAGIGRDYPPSDIGDWPVVELPQESFKTLDRVRTQEHTYNETMNSVSKFPLVNTPYLYPIYSNTGIDLLGLSNVAANRLASSSSDTSTEPQTHRELIKRDVLDPLGLNSSFYRLPSSDALRAHIAVPNKDPKWADISLGDMDDAAGGQYSSLGDLATFMKTLLSPNAKGVISAPVVREWLRPLYVWGESTQQVGAPWEVISLEGLTAYTKGGNLPGYHSEFALVPEYSVGIIVLVTGTYADTHVILQEAGKRFLPVFEKLHEVELKRRYVGTWANGEDVAEVELREKGALYLKKLIVRGVDVLGFVQGRSAEGGNVARGTAPVGLWSTGRVGEFRLAFGRPELNDVPNIGCMPYWVTIDPGLFSRGAPIDVLYWKNGILTYPSAGVNFARKL